MVDWSGRPAYVQVADDLRKQIYGGRFPPGGRLPSYEALMKRYEVSITVVRAAIRELKTQGLVDSHLGKGVTVRYPLLPSLPGERRDREVLCALAEMRKLRGRLARLDGRLTRVERVVLPVGG